MPSASNGSPSVFSSPSGRRIISRIASPFSSKPRNVTDFSIEPNDPLKQHGPGDIVTGHVRLRVSKPTRVTHIVVCLHGFVQVYRNPGSPGDGFRANSGYLGAGRGKKSGEYFGNGFASLFEDEIVLCGDGRLAEGTYQFNFELDFPDRDLPSSIDFERGTITYMITATMTRPTTMSPTISKDRKIHFLERIDISPLYPPKSRTITLEPVAKRSRARTQARKLVDASDRKSRKTDSVEHPSDVPRQSEASSAPSMGADSTSPESPIQSEVSTDSRRSSQAQASQPDSYQRVSPIDSEESRINASKGSLANRIITATIESQAGGCLRGDCVPIKININHTKPIRSVYGVIVTLYRQARVDMHPSIPLGPTEKGKDAKFKDYYPRSMTGLGGLSLSGSGSSHIFRKDMSQVMAPLMIDPQTHTAEINTKIRVPEEAFPTISTVPGAMISFKYYVEVVLDIQGRLAGQDRSFTNLSGPAAVPGQTINSEGSDMERSAFTPFGSTIVDTAPIRRDKSVVSSTFELVIGTQDSERRKGKRKLMDAAPESNPQQPQVQQEQPQQVQGAPSGVDWDDPNAYHATHWYDQQYWYWYPPDPTAQNQQYYPGHGEIYDVPPPSITIPDESQMTDKERVQQAETRLLPSQPPGAGAEQGDQFLTSATAPYLPDELPASDPLMMVPSYSTVTPAAHASNSDTLAGGQPRQRSGAPEYAPPEAGSTPTSKGSTLGDKQEMQRRQLQSEASGPPDDNDDGGGTAWEDHAPIAPTVAEEYRPADDIHNSHADAVGSSGLPRYER